MGVGVSLILFATGAVLAFALKVDSPVVDLDAVGVILMLAGVVGFIVSLIMWNSWGGFSWGPFASTTERTVVRDREIVEHDHIDPVVEHTHTHHDPPLRA